uniref:Large ribosomal subunit protein eL15 n=1 Tax=Candidatus Methanomethylicus mesodigestus TaxID=1867258 RepID=A0A7C3IKS8_9CREN
MSAYKYIGEAWKKPREGIVRSMRTERFVKWRRGPAINEVEVPTRLDRARILGYKAKQGIIVARIRIIRGPMNVERPNSGRRPKRMGVLGITSRKGTRAVAEERVARKYPNMNVIGSYWVGSDGRYSWYEVILVDPAHPSITSDKDLSWVSSPAQRNRVFKGLTAAGKRGRGLYRSGKGTEKLGKGRSVNFK